jgi:formiminoglutamate deiminase
MTAYWCEHLLRIGDTVIDGALVEVAGERITSVSTVDAPPPGAVVLRGLTVPGLANAHSHAFHRALRGRTHGGHGSFWTWRDQMYGLVERLDPDTYYALARAVYGEMALAGITCVGEFHYLHHGPGGIPYDDPNAMGSALIAAAHDAGIRITLLDTCYLHGGIGVEPNEVQRRFSDLDVERWIGRVGDLRAGTTGSPHARLGVALHSVRAVDPHSIAVASMWAADRRWPFHAHVSEQPAENEACRAKYGVSPVGLFARHGAISRRFTAVHANHVDHDDIATLGAAHAVVCCCPTTERDLADGAAPTGRLERAGVRLTVGSDSHAVIDLFEEMRAVETHERLSTLARGNHRIASLLAAGTEAGHESLGWPDGGVIGPGQLADLVTLSLDSVRTAGGGASAATAVFAATAADVVHVVSSGRVIVRDGAHATMDVPAELGRTIGALYT